MRAFCRRRSPAESLLSAAVALVACSSFGLSACKPKAPPLTSGAATPVTAAPPSPPISMLTPSRLLPDIRGVRGVVAYENGARRVLLDRMRIVLYEDGTLQRATELLPLGNVNSIALPSRLGGGFLFQATTGGGTQLWRASSWLSKLKPLVQISSTTSEVVPGFDRLYLRLSHSNKLVAIDPETGAVRSLAPLPPAAAYGGLAFADGFSAVIESDLRGVLATFDAGGTWRPLGLSERPSAISVVAGEPTMFIPGGRYVLDSRGVLTFRADKQFVDDVDSEPAPVRPPGPFGRRPLRAALEDGFPDSMNSVVVARAGALARVSLETGAITELVSTAFEEREAACHATRVGPSYGFVCGERDGATSVYTFAPPLSMQKVMSFKKPRFVSSSGNGALVVRGPCGEGPTDEEGTRVYCVRASSGATREVRVKGDLGVERVVALSDGRVAVLVPPRLGNTGQLTLLDGGKMSSIALVLPSKPRMAARELKRGMWLEGFEEREPGVLSGWVEAGGPVIGVRVALDGKVTAGEPRDNENGVIVSGRFALSQGEGGRAAESTDGGMTWTVFDMPSHDVEPDDAKTRACGPAGCALSGWVRIGWGKPGVENDLGPAETPPSLYVPLKSSAVLQLRCAVSSDKPATEPLPDKPSKPAPAAPPPPSFGPFPVPFGMHGPPVQQKSSWSSFRNTAPPALASDELGIDNGAPFDIVSMRAYAWGKKGADWARTGHFLIRFDDRFDPAGGLRSSAIGASPWADETAAAEGMGLGSYPLASWGAFLDPSGRHALAHVCRGNSCSLYATSEGQPALLLRDTMGRTTGFVRPIPHGAVRLGESWFFVVQGNAYDTLSLYRADLGVLRLVSSFYRPAPSRSSLPEMPRLVRRALGTGLGFLVTSLPDPGERNGAMFVYPIDPAKGTLGEPIALGKRDLKGNLPARCAEGQDGWLMDTGLENAPAIELISGHAPLDSVEMRLRLDPGSACVEGIAARIDGVFVPDKDGPAKPEADKASAKVPAVPLSATERSTGRRWSFSCSKR